MNPIQIAMNSAKKTGPMPSISMATMRWKSQPGRISTTPKDGSPSTAAIRESRDQRRDSCRGGVATETASDGVSGMSMGE
jgi:hypothetical protein